MKRLTQILPVILAAALQLMPLLRNIVTSPAANSSFAIILRWTIGSAATLGVVDAVSGSTSVYTSPSTFSGTVGTPFSNNVVCAIGGGNNASRNDYFVVSSGSVSSPTLTNYATTTLTLPPGLTFMASWVNGSTTIGGIIYGTPTTAGIYPTTITVVSPGNAVLAQNITITITGSGSPTAPTITTQPLGTNVLAGKNATFTVVASGSAPLGYFWLKNGVSLANGGNIFGANTATLTLTNITATDTANYSVLVSNSVGSLTSATAALAIISPPTISTQPVSQSLVAGSTAQFAVTAGGSPPLAYKWLKNGAVLANGGNASGATTGTLTLATVSSADAANYSVIITNSSGSVTSAVAALTVLLPPAIATQPASASVLAGSNVSFIVTASGTALLGYQWLKNGLVLANGGNVSGANTATLSLATVASADTANYSVTITNSVGNITSSIASLTVLTTPTISTQPLSQNLVAGSTAQFTVSVGGSNPLAYQWFKNGAVLANGGNVSGATTATLSLAAVASADAANYSVTITNSAGSITSTIATLTVLLPPAIVIQPASASVLAGSNVSFSVSASGTAPLSYQWLKNGLVLANGGNVSGAATATLSLTGVSAADTANYSVTITNSAGSVTSGNATLTLLSGAIVITTQPASATVAQGKPVTFNVTASSTSALYYQWLKNGVNLSGSNSNTLIFAAVSTNDAGNYSVMITNSANIITGAIATLTVLLPPAIVTQPANASVLAGSNVSFTVTASGSAPLRYQWLKNGLVLANGSNVSGATTATLSLATVSSVDTANYSVTVTNSVGSITSSTASLNVSTPPSISTQPVSESLVAGSTAQFTVNAGGSTPLAYQWLKNGAVVANGGNASGATTATLSLATVSSADVANYSVTVTNSAGSITSAIATLTVLLPPVIVTQPANASILAGSNVSFSVSASGTAPLSYQWLKNGIALTDVGNVSGVTTSTLSLTGVSDADMANYSVTITNSVGSVASSTASLTVLTPPTIVTQPAGISVAPGSNVTFSVTAGGTAPLSYQWLKNGGVISGATAATLNLANVSVTDAAGYSVVVTNSVGKVTSGSAVLTVVTPLVILTQPASQLVPLGIPVVFNVVASGAGTISYQWFKGGLALADGGTISGSTTSNLNVTMVTASNAGVYSVVVTNLNGSITSSNAILTIPPSSGSFNAIAGTYFNNNVAISLPTGQTAGVNDYFILSAGAANSPLLANGQSTTTTLPPGLTFVASWVNGASALTGVIYGTPTASGSYPITVSIVSPGNPVISQNIILNIANPTGSSGQTATNPPVEAITNQPVGVTVVAGGSASFNVLASGTSPIGYQWYFNTSTSLPNAISSTLNLTNIRVSQDGFYSVVVTNAAGAITSTPARLTVTLPSSPAILPPVATSAKFQFTFNPVIGLTNSIMTNNSVSGGNWGVLTNVPPPATANPITVTDTIGGTNRFYRVRIIP